METLTQAGTVLAPADPASLLSGMRRDTYKAHAFFIRPAATHTEMWRVIVMILSFEFGFLVGPLLIALALPQEAAASYLEGTSALATLAHFASFGITAAIFIWLLRRVHHRGFWSLVGRPDIAWTDLWRTTMAVGIVLLLFELLPPWVAVTELAEIRSLGRWLAFLPFAIVVLVIQVTTEEIYFRGYLQQQLACRSSSRVVWMLMPSLIFGASHYTSGHGPADTALYVMWATALGLACADLTARTGTLGAAIGLHLANNIFALLIVGVQGWPLSGLALFLYPYFDPTEYDYSIAILATPSGIFEILTTIGGVAVLWLAARVAIRR